MHSLDLKGMVKENHTSLSFFSWLKRKVKKNKYQPIKGDRGLFQYIYQTSTIGERSFDTRYNVYVIIEVEEIFEDIIKVKCVDLRINDSVGQDVTDMVTKNFPMYLEIDEVKWENK